MTATTVLEVSPAPAAPAGLAGNVPLTALWEAPSDPGEHRGGGMPPELAERYGGDLTLPLRPDRPTVVANFVSTLDGVVALGRGDLSGGGLISGSHEPDRFVMALLRAVADVVVVGAGTLRESTHQRWTAAHLQPELEGSFAAWRRALGLAEHPTTVIVSGSGAIPLDHPGLRDPAVPVVVMTTPHGADRLAARGAAAGVTIEAVGRDGALGGRDILAAVSSLGARVALCEGGPHLLAELIGADVLDELFLTLAPQLVGRGDPARLGLLEGLALGPGARWQELVGVRRSTHHLFLRYRRANRPATAKEA